MGTSSTTSNAEIARNPHAPEGFRAARGASASLALLDDATTSPARRLASAPAAPGTRPLLILGQAP